MPKYIKRLKCRTLDEARALIDGEKPRMLRIDNLILATICYFEGIDLFDFRNHRRTAVCVRVRQVVMYLVYKHTNCSMPKIGSHLGGRDHTTVLSGVNRMADLAAADLDWKRHLVNIWHLACRLDHRLALLDPPFSTEVSIRAETVEAPPIVVPRPSNPTDEKKRDEVASDALLERLRLVHSPRRPGVGANGTIPDPTT